MYSFFEKMCRKRWLSFAKNTSEILTSDASICESIFA
jgi:hypothetical protein